MEPVEASLVSANGLASNGKHESQSPPDADADFLSELMARAAEVPQRLGRLVTAWRERQRGSYFEDDWGFDEQFMEAAFPIFDFLYSVYWRVKTAGVQRVPSHGRVMLVGNHAGTFPWDGTMMGMAIMKEHPLPRVPRAMVLNWAFQLPYMSYFMRKVGCVVASPYNATKLLEQDHMVAVFPEGAKGVSKRYKDRYRLQRFGRGGFVEIALRTGSPIVPVAVVGSEEVHPIITNSQTLGRALGAPYFPITPTFPWLGLAGLIPLPSKWRIEFCDPVDLSGYGPDDAENSNLVFEISQAIKDTIQEQIYTNLIERGRAFGP